MSMETLGQARRGMDPDVRAFLAGLDQQHAPPINKLAPDRARALLDKVQSIDVPRVPADVSDISVPGGPRGQVPVRIVRPAGAVGELPGVVYLHGGGWVLGDRDTHDRLVRELAYLAEAAVLFVDYTRSPEAQFPVALEESYAVLQHAAGDGPGHGVDPSRLAVAGDSVGGNMATALALMARDRLGPQIRAQALFYPVTDAGFDTASYRQFGGGGYWLTRDAMKWFWDQYLPDREARKQPLASPLRAPLEELQGLPPALIITDEYDVLRDEGEAYAGRLLEAGVSVAAVRILGTIHDFMMLNPLAGTPPTSIAVSLAGMMLLQALA